MSTPVPTSHNKALPVLLPARACLPSGENTTELMRSDLVENDETTRPRDVSQTFTVPSLLPDSSRLPSKENLTDVTVSECPEKMRTSTPVSIRQDLIFLSAP